jgi:hypothetical protein
VREEKFVQRGGEFISVEIIYTIQSRDYIHDSESRLYTQISSGKHVVEIIYTVQANTCSRLYTRFRQNRSQDYIHSSGKYVVEIIYIVQANT